MSEKLSSSLVEEIQTYDDEKRAKYFFKEVVLNNKIWILTDEHGCVMLNTEEDDCVPVWPNEEFASVLLIARTDYLENNPELVKNWLKSHKETVVWINSNADENKEIKMIPEMLNLLGCSKDNFKKLLQKMGYKTYEKEQDMFFKYNPVKKFKKIQNKKVSNENPFKVLKNLKLG